MQLQEVTYEGPPIDDVEILEASPPGLAALLRQVNGFVQFGGGLHVRGACADPAWHSLREAWQGETAFHRIYREVTPEDVPFAQDCLGDQFLLRDGSVVRLMAETGELEDLHLPLGDFLEAAQGDPVETLELEPLLQFHEEGGELEPGQLLNLYPPLCTVESAEGLALSAVPVDQRLGFLARLYQALEQLPEGEPFPPDFQP